MPNKIYVPTTTLFFQVQLVMAGDSFPEQNCLARQLLGQLSLINIGARAVENMAFNILAWLLAGGPRILPKHHYARGNNSTYLSKGQVDQLFVRLKGEKKANKGEALCMSSKAFYWQV